MLINKLEDFLFPCGCDLVDVGLDEVFVRDLTSSDHVENLYYSLGHEIICINCSEQIEQTIPECGSYPQFEGCKDLPAVQKYGN